MLCLAVVAKASIIILVGHTVYSLGDLIKPIMLNITF